VERRGRRQNFPEKLNCAEDPTNVINLVGIARASIAYQCPTSGLKCGAPMNHLKHKM
jgi:hypothetical protein